MTCEEGLREVDGTRDRQKKKKIEIYISLLRIQDKNYS